MRFLNEKAVNGNEIGIKDRHRAAVWELSIYHYPHRQYRVSFIIDRLTDSALIEKVENLTHMSYHEVKFKNRMYGHLAIALNTSKNRVDQFYDKLELTSLKIKKLGIKMYSMRCDRTIVEKIFD